MLASRLLAEMRAGHTPSAALVRHAQTDGYRAFGLQAIANTRPSPLRYALPLDDAYLKRVARQVAASRYAGKRLGLEWVPDKRTELRANDDVWVTREELKPLDDVCTKLVTRKYFPDAFARLNMVVNVARLYDRLAQLGGTDAEIVFKGGVAIRLVLLECLHDLPHAARRHAIEYLSAQKALGISDFDFEMVVPHGGKKADPSEDAVHRMYAVHYAVLLWLMQKMEHEARRGHGEGLLRLDWDRDAAAEELRVMLQSEVQGLDAAHPMRGATIDRVVVGGHVDAPPKGYATKGGRPAPTPRRNLFLFRNGKKEEGKGEDIAVATAADVFAAMGVDAVPTRAGRDFYATTNSYIGEGETAQREGHLLGLFHLCRIKQTFVMYYTTRDGHQRCDRLAGEMVDLSMSHGRGDAARRTLYADVAHPYREYPLLGVADTSLRSYALQGFLFDHRLMLHHKDVPPWEVVKAEKRQARYAAFLVASVLAEEAGGWERKRAAIRALADRTRTRAALCSAPPLRTGVPLVDAFAAREAAALRAASPIASRGYLETLHAHLRAMADALYRDEDATQLLLDPSHLEHAEEHIYVFSTRA